MYDPGLQRFLQPDPLGFGGGQDNDYEFVGDNPVNDTDPTGLFSTLGVLKLLEGSPAGRDALETISKGKVVVYAVDYLKYYYRERPNENAPWGPWKPWSTTTGLAFTQNGVKIIYVLTERSDIDAAVTIIHEATHARQPAGMTTFDAELEAFRKGARFLVENPSLIPKVSATYRGFLTKNKEGTYCVNEEAIRTYLKKSPAYNPNAKLLQFKQNPDGTDLLETGKKVRVLSGAGSPGSK